MMATIWTRMAPEMIVIPSFHAPFWFGMIHVIAISINTHSICVWCIWPSLVAGARFLLRADVYNYLNVLLFDLTWLTFDFIFITDSADK